MKIILVFVLMIVCAGVYSMVFITLSDNPIKMSLEDKEEKQEKETVESKQIQFSKQIEEPPSNKSSSMTQEDYINIFSIVLTGVLLFYIYYLIRKSKKKT